MKKLQNANRFAIFLLVAILLAGLWGVVGLMIYRKNGSYAVDLSRPAYRKAHRNIHYDTDHDRPKITKDGQPDQAFKQAVQAGFEYYLKQIDKEAFAERAISDEALGLLPSEK